MWPIKPGTFPNAAVPGAPAAHLGKGLFSPLREDPVTGDFQRVEDELNVQQCLRDGILTAFGERVMQEALGTEVRDMLFEQDTVVTDIVPMSVRDFIERFEPRVILRSCTCLPIARSDNHVEFRLSVVYTLRATNRPQSLVFPFFLSRDQ